eukprot:NODE_127_length_18646_cov_0.421632.p4 type:complete len:283 gc:universal NODE_127_length_18646_cov_0.421632:9171-8323(-)
MLSSFYSVFPKFLLILFFIGFPETKMTSTSPTEINDPRIHALAGTFGGLTSTLITYPLISLSTRLQTNSQAKHSLYSGIESALFGISITNSVFYYVYEALSLSPLLRSTAAGAVTAVSTNPIWVINARLTNKKMSFMDCINEISSEGIPSLFKGVLPSLILVSNPVIQYTLYDRWIKKTDKSYKMVFLVAAITKLIATFITYPYLVIKSRQQIDKDNLSIKEHMKKVYEDLGLYGFYKGVLWKCVQTVINSSFLFLFKEFYVDIAKILLLGKEPVKAKVASK